MSYDWITNAARHASLHIKPEHTPAERTEIIVAKIKQVLDGETDLDAVREKYLESVIAAQADLIDKQSAFIHASQSPTNVGRTITEISKGVYSSGSRPGRVDEARVAEIVNNTEAVGLDERLLDAIGGVIATYETGDHADKPCGGCAICELQKALRKERG